MYGATAMQSRRLSTLTSTLRPVTPGDIERFIPLTKAPLRRACRTLILRRTLHFNLGQVRKSLFDKPSQFAGALYGRFNHLVIRQGAATIGNLTKKLGSLPASAHTLPDIQTRIDEFFQRADEFYPSDKIREWRKSVDSVISTATTLYQVVKEAAEQRSIPLYTVSKDLRDTFSVSFEEHKEQFPSPDEAPGHEKRMTMINTILDRVEECFLQVVCKLGVSRESLSSLTGSLKSGLKHILVTIGNIDEQHPNLVRAISRIVISMPFADDDLGFLLAILHIVGFKALRPKKGGFAAWLRGWLFGPAVPKNS
ncbi:uncharacterized protein EDB93DRAFT_79509 [Suillus bovinus]|uniref:uncharacterized protein n=1 Tax=Suillus bovinus TaxID=48563 RepID=UPI001B887066|nr:uncharacterized protein EDB93DRAFT_79509 [Suillus bovinus]KAG2130449.1 hypothetical protein EDB93DRAFT_79509 [Suillus bovinus]